MYLSFSKQAGCRPPWDDLSPISTPVCNNSRDWKKYQELEGLLFSVQQKIIMNRTGCLIPCKYREYHIEDVPQTVHVANHG